MYVAMFAIIFCETGLIVTPFLPGDSLLFALGALTVVSDSSGEPALHFATLAMLLVIAAILGDQVNYSVGRWLGPRLFNNRNSKILNPEHLERTHAFYQRHGGKTVVIARFLPILRTYAPFVAGLSRMNFARFAMFNVFGGVAWILIFLTLGHFFANLPIVKKNFQYVILGIIVVSVLPLVYEFFRARRESAAGAALSKQEVHR
jgi:membrane-associated protein